MHLPYFFAIGLRYTSSSNSGRGNGFMSFLSLVSTLGIALGVIALITVTSVMNGFRSEMTNRILGASSHITVHGPGIGLDSWKSIADKASQHPEVEAAAPYFEAQVMLSFRGRSSAVVVRGVLPESEKAVSKLSDSLVGESTLRAVLEPGADRVLVGKELAYFLNVIQGDRLMLITAEPSSGGIGFVPKVFGFEVGGSFEFGLNAVDRNVAVVHIADGSSLLSQDQTYTGIQLKIKDPIQAPVVARELESLVGPVYSINDWTQDNSAYFEATQLEKMMMAIVLSMIVAVAAFNICSALVMVVQDKSESIAILRTLGSSPAMIVAIFIVQGTIAGIVGTILGLLFGLLLAYNLDIVIPILENVVGPIFDPELFYITDMPSEVQMPDVFKIVVLSLVLSFLATLYPSWKASQIDPSRALS